MNSSESTRQPKSVLFCPHCEYSSGADSGWLQYSVAGHTQRRCPACYEVVDERPSNEPPHGLGRYSEQVQSGLVACRVGLHRWRKSVRELASL